MVSRVIHNLQDFDEVWCCDTEYHAPDGERPRVINLCAIEVVSGREILLWEDDLNQLDECPFRTDDRAMFVCWTATAELSVWHQLGWDEPAVILDLYCEERVLNNGRYKGKGQFGVLETCRRYGIDGIGADEKDKNRELAIRGFPFTECEKRSLNRYVKSDVVALTKLLPVMLPKIKHPRLAMFRSAYMKATARTEHAGTPLDPQIDILKKVWEKRLPQLVEEVDLKYDCYEGLRFSQDKFEDYLEREGIEWPLTATGLLSTEQQTFSDMSQGYPQLSELHELRKCVSDTKNLKVAYGKDFRNRTGLVPFGTETGRNAPSGNKFLFTCSKVHRFWVKPEEGWALANLDFRAQEVGIGASLSGDRQLMEMYSSGDPYLMMGKRAGSIPPEGTKSTHGEERGMFKALSLGIIYGMATVTLASRIGCSMPEAEGLMRFHKNTFFQFWKWLNQCVSSGLLKNEIVTRYGWYRTLIDHEILGTKGEVQVRDTNVRSVQNFFMQAHAAHILQVSMIQLWDANIQVVAPLHDSVLIYAPIELIDEQVEQATQIMENASRIVLNGYTIDVESQIVRYPDRLGDESPGAIDMWEKILRLVPEIKEYP